MEQMVKVLSAAVVNLKRIHTSSRTGEFVQSASLDFYGLFSSVQLALISL